jgi:signal transduction histidine kinase
MLPTTGNDCSNTRLNVAIVGGGESCRFFLGLLRQGLFASLEVSILGVCDRDPEAPGMVLAREMGIPTTCDYRELFDLDGLQTIIELTHDRELLLELVRRKPPHVGVIEHNTGRLLQRFLTVDQRLRAKEQEADRERMLTDFLIQQTNERILVLNRDFTIAEANARFLKWVRKTREEVINAPCHLVTYGFDQPCFLAQPEWSCPLQETLRTGESAHVIHDQAEYGSQDSYCDLVTYPVRSESGEIVQVIEIMHDITQELLSKWERRTRHLMEDLEKLVREDRMITLGKLVASCVHEINNPLQGLITYAYLLEDILGADSIGEQELQNVRRYASVMKRELERCGSITSGLLSFSREKPVEFKQHDLNEIIRSTLSLTQHRMQLQNIRLRQELSSATLVVKGDLNQLQQCLLNLLFNAIEAMPDGGEIAVVSALDSDGWTRVEIRDSGCGIEAGDLGHIFDPFFTTKQEGEGTGLGLSILYGMVNKHSGTVDVDSAPGRGTMFTLRFPPPDKG